MGVSTINEIAIMLQNHIDNEKERHDVFDAKLDGITTRLDYTNGNVKDLLLWKSFLIGGMVVISIMVIPLLVYVWTNWH